MKKQQQGTSLIGLIFIGILVVGAAILMMKIVPPYLEFWSVRKIIAQIARDPALPGMTPEEIRRSFDKRASIDYVSVINSKDLDISKASGSNVVTAHYTVTVPLVANLSALMEFDASTKDSQSAPKMPQ